MKKLIITLTTAALPFLLVWAAWILTAFNFNPHTVFSDGSFWGASVLYWFLWICICPLIIEMIDEAEKVEERKAKSVLKEEMIQKHLNNHAKYTRVTPEYEAFVRDALDKLD